jgi:hypothetical protein
MCRISLVFTRSELKTLSKKQQDILQKYGKRLVDTSQEIRNIIKKDPKVRRKLKALLRPQHRQMISKSK